MGAFGAKVDEKVGVDFQAAVGVGVDLRHPTADAFGVELGVQGGIERIGRVEPLAVATDLHHLRRAVERSALRVGGMAHHAPQLDRTGQPGVEGIADVVLAQLAGSPAGDIEHLVVQR